MNTLEQNAYLLTVEQYNYPELKEALARLYENKDFQKVILEGYIRDSALRQVSLLAHDYTVQSGTRPQLMEMLVAISRLEDYFRVINAMGTQGFESFEDETEDEATQQ